LNNLDAFQQFPFVTKNSNPAATLAIPCAQQSIQTADRAMHKRLSFFAIVGLASLSLGPSVAAQDHSAVTPRETAPAAAANPSNAARHENRDPLLDLPELPPAKVTLIGGTVKNVDEIMNKMTVEPFGTNRKMQVAFDTRTDFFQDGKPISYRTVREGQRVYLDTMLNGSTVFAKKIWIQTAAENGVGRGQIVEYDPGHKSLTVRDELSNQPIKFQLNASTTVNKGKEAATAADLVPGALVTVSFGPQRELREVTLLAKPGSTFVFAGPITYLDLSRKLIALNNRTDRTRYDVSVKEIAPSILRELREGANVNVSAVFDGKGYQARNIDIASAKSDQDQ
jgi:hypothetical protein